MANSSITKPLERVFAEGSILFNEKDPGGDIFVIRAGQVEVFRVRDGREWTLARLGKDEILGVMTATTGTSRTASARAITETTVVVIPKAQLETVLKTMPPWGRAIIKDLIERVKNSSDLYINAAIAGQRHSAFDPLTVACLIASSLGPILELLRGSDNKTVPLDELLSKVGDVVGLDKQVVNDTVKLFIEERLLEPKDKHSTGFEQSALDRLRQFNDFVQDLRSRAAQQDFLAPLLTINERKQLADIAEVAIALTGGGQEESDFEIDLLRRELSKDVHKILDPQLLKRAEALKYLSSSRSSEASVRFSPQRLMTIVRSYEVAKRLDPKILAESALKKAILY